VARFAQGCANGQRGHVDWVKGDAEELPFGEEHFDRVLSAFGVRFAPRHDTTAAKLVHIYRSGGRIVVVNWTPDSASGELLETIGGYMPAPPAFASLPPLRGSEEHVRPLFAGGPVDLEFARGHNRLCFDSPEHFAAFFETRYGPTLKAREHLESERTWDACRGDMLALAQRRNQATDGSPLTPAEYLVATAYVG
jgi:SAM-dependent methyltransferase